MVLPTVLMYPTLSHIYKKQTKRLAIVSSNYRVCRKDNLEDFKSTAENNCRSSFNFESLLQELNTQFTTVTS